MANRNWKRIASGACVWVTKRKPCGAPARIELTTRAKTYPLCEEHYWKATAAPGGVTTVHPGFEMVSDGLCLDCKKPLTAKNSEIDSWRCRPCINALAAEIETEVA